MRAMTVTPDEHLRWILERVSTTPVREVSVRDAQGCTAAQDHLAKYELPLWDNSAMDGYAMRSADIAGATAEQPTQLMVVGEVAAGSSEDPRIPPGACVRIMTGAPIPAHADTVVPVERTVSDRDGEDWADASVGVLEALPVGANVRRRGESTSAGDVIAARGEVLTAARLGALAAAGVERVQVHAAPRIAVLTTGSELRPAGVELVRGQIPESNSLLVSGLLRETGVAVITEISVHDDDVEGFRRALAKAADCDVIVTTGGVGPGRHDIVRLALVDEPGVRQVRVAVRPGQPQCVGRLAEGAFIFALPGNPVSAAVSFELFVRPAILAMQGRSRLQRLRIPIRAATGWRGKAGRLQVLPVRVFEDERGAIACAPVVDPSGVPHAVTGHGAADGYALVGPERGDVAAGEIVDVTLVTS